MPTEREMGELLANVSNISQQLIAIQANMLRAQDAAAQRADAIDKSSMSRCDAIDKASRDGLAALSKRIDPLEDLPVQLRTFTRTMLTLWTLVIAAGTLVAALYATLHH